MTLSRLFFSHEKEGTFFYSLYRNSNIKKKLLSCSCHRELISFIKKMAPRNALVRSAIKDSTSKIHDQFIQILYVFGFFF